VIEEIKNLTLTDVVLPTRKGIEIQLRCVTNPHIVVARQGIKVVCVSTSSQIEKVKARCQRAEHIKSSQSPKTFVRISPLDCQVDKECAVDCNFAFVTEIFKIVNNPSFKLLASGGIGSKYIDRITSGIQSSRMIGEEIRKYLR
jgi:hypothetical protein